MGTPSIARMNSGVTRLMWCPHSKIATYWYRYFLFTPRNGRRKFRSPVHSPSRVLLWTSRTPSPSSSRAHSPTLWQTTERGCPVSVSRSYPLQSSVWTRAGGSDASRTTRFNVALSACRSTDRRSWPLSRPTTPQTGGRSLSQVPWPGTWLARRRGGSWGSGCDTPFFPRVLVQLVSFHHRVVQPPLASEPPGQVLEPMPQRQQLLAVAPQLAGQLGGGDPLSEAPEDHHQLDGPSLGARQGRAGEGIEHPVTDRAAIVEDRGTVTAVDAQALACPAPRADQAAGVKPGEQLGVAGLLVHQFGDGEVHGRLRLSRGDGSPSMTSRTAGAVKDLSTSCPS